MSATRCPFAAQRIISANHTTGGRKAIRGFVPHVQVGTGSLFGFFNTPKPPGQGASSDFWCSKAGELEQYVDLADQAWAQGSSTHNGNPTFISCEFEGFPNEPMTPEQIAAGGRLIAWSREEVNDWPLQLNLDPDNGYGITPHHVFGGGHTCPGPGPREGQFPDLIAAAAGTGPAPKPPEEPMKATYIANADEPDPKRIFLLFDSGLMVQVRDFADAEEMFREQLKVDIEPYRETQKVNDSRGAVRDVWYIGTTDADGHNRGIEFPK